jgi:hypothetical protein
MDKADMAELGCKSKACVNALHEREARKEFEVHVWKDLWLGDIRLPRGRISLSGVISVKPFTVTAVFQQSKTPIGTSES